MEHALGHILGHTSFNKFERTKIVQFTFCNCNTIKLKFSSNKIARKLPNIQVLSTILKNYALKKKSQKIRKNIEQSFHKE